MTRFFGHFSILLVSLFLFVTVPAFANVVRTTSQTTARPVAAYSNFGSEQALFVRSATGTSNKFSHDGYRVIW